MSKKSVHSIFANRNRIVLIMLVVALAVIAAACAPAPAPTATPPKAAPQPTAVPPTAVPPTAVPQPTAVPPTAVPPTAAPRPTTAPTAAPTTTSPTVGPTTAAQPAATPGSDLSPAATDKYPLPKGKAGVVFQSYCGYEMTISIAGTKYKLPAKTGGTNPTEVFVILDPGQNNYSTSSPVIQGVTDTLDRPPDTLWFLTWTEDRC